ncbi:phospholipase D/nuclease [Nadsonia fulvescens var. elongata DSM 6958]|uniref:Phospholipase D1 n=1 Tax=Nadsonia fulvescens var. elongata DSM 6958 TaxID=857566 RepID=A0A1E3PH05_9ASCO|nr:phospholipase D/nuclease [Nadsonia fulvescens var. elongata DSM 6958]
MKEQTVWSRPKRFSSFAPVRHNCYAQWFVDGRDYYWALSSAIDLATDVIYIHDWWLSPELYLRRPVDGNQEWRIDRLLKRKAQEGVKIFIVIYRNLDQFIPIDSNYSKYSLLDLHPNIYVMRSPNQLMQNTYFWAHHEKLFIIDHTVGFVGGLDLCFGRYDTFEHALNDDSPDIVDKGQKTMNETSLAVVPASVSASVPLSVMNPAKMPPAASASNLTNNFNSNTNPRANNLASDITPVSSIMQPPMSAPTTAGTSTTITDESITSVGSESVATTSTVVPASSNLSTVPPGSTPFNDNKLSSLVTPFEPSSATNLGANGTQIWPGKDYSNPRVKDFYDLDKPFEDMYDRNKVPRMPWHDVHMMTMGNPARDLARHFVQRWNYLLRQKRPSRSTPMLLPPPDFTEEEIEQLDIKGTCEVQILRSACGWSTGLVETETSIQNAYCRAIENSDHFIYIENQFFVTSTSFDGTVIDNQIGNALVERIIRAHESDENWRAVIMIPLMPGFESQVDLAEGTSVRIIMQCQYMSISRGPNSILGKLEAAGVQHPDDYIQFFSLRKWGKVGPNKKIVTEQLYIHAKTMIVDDRVAIIGSANINERSMRGVRDSEVAAIVRDTCQIDSFMGGKPYKVGKFAHSLRMRLMREHLGIDIDKLAIIEHETEQFLRGSNSAHGSSSGIEPVSTGIPDTNDTSDKRDSSTSQPYKIEEFEPKSFNHLAGTENRGMREKKKISKDPRVQDNSIHRNDVEGKGYDAVPRNRMASLMHGQPIQRDDALSESIKSKLRYLEANVDLISKHIGQGISPDDYETAVDFKRAVYMESITEATRSFNDKGVDSLPGPEAAINTDDHDANTVSPTVNMNGSASTAVENKLPASVITGKTENIIDPNGKGSHSSQSNGISSENGLSEDDFNSFDFDPEFSLKHPSKPVDPFGFDDPLDDSFYVDTWLSIAVRNTGLFRKVFRCQPDNEVSTWKEYKEYATYGEKFSISQDKAEDLSDPKEEAKVHSPFGIGSSELEEKFVELQSKKKWPENIKPETAKATKGESSNKGENTIKPTPDTAQFSETDQTQNSLSSTSSSAGDETVVGGADNPTSNGNGIPAGKQRRRRMNTYNRARKSTAIGDILSPAEAEKQLNCIQGHLVIFPVDWLAKELESGNWFYNADRLPPIQVYD